MNSAVKTIRHVLDKIMELLAASLLVDSYEIET